ncbi:hypothetical protein [Tsukamurella sp. PLM1]|nr:hypothetical protein [Tsukamurella sp. PLM1]
MPPSWICCGDAPHARVVPTVIVALRTFTFGGFFGSLTSITARPAIDNAA